MSNQLQALLKSKNIEISVDLDREKSLSNIKNGLKSLKDNLDGFNIDLGVKFNPNVKELNQEIKELQDKIKNSKSVSNAIKLDVSIDSSIDKLNKDIQNLQGKIQNAKTIKPIKLDVVIDVQGSAKKITEELNEIKSVLNEFKSDYSKALSNIKELGNDEFSELLSDSTVRKLSGNIDNVKDYMHNAFGDGIISTKTIKDSQDNIQALSATIKKETGEMHTSLFKLSESGALELIKQEDVNNMEAQTARAKKSISSLSDEVKKVKSLMDDSKSSTMFNKLSNQQFVSEGEVNNLKTLLKAEKDLLETQRRRKEFQRELTSALKSMSPEISNVVKQVEKMDKSLDSLDSNELDKLSKELKELSNQYKSDEAIFKKRASSLKEIKKIESEMDILYQRMSKTQANSKLFRDSTDILERSKVTIKLTDNMKDLNKATRDLEKAQQNLGDIKLAEKIEAQNSAMAKQVDEVKNTIKALRDIGKFNDRDSSNNELILLEKIGQSQTAVKNFGNTLKKELEEAKQEQKDLIKNFMLIEQHTNNASKKSIQSGIFQGIKSKDTTALKQYFGELKKGEVSTISLRETTNQYGQAIDEVKVKMTGTGKTVEAYTFEVNKAKNATEQYVKQTGTAIVDNENKSLGFFSQLGIAMKRVPSWILSMQSFYAVVNGFKKVGKEIMEINAQMIEIQRVASDGLNVDSLFNSALAQSKELGVNIHEVLDALGEFTRSYGDFTESQLLAVNNTAVMMANVSDLTLGESVENLIGTMNAFNIEAEDSIRIVDSLNEVDNNYSISTKQLADSLSKAGATAKTFGLTLEEVAGHTTAIGAVTMESGDIIGNSLKTIYSRITTMDESIDILDSLGIAVQEVTENGIEMRGVGDILGDLAGQWDSLSNTQRQNIGVTIAGRNQLSRFLAIMNNWEMAQDATTTALNSTGSAIKEQGIYMDSYEAKVAGLKTRFTELSLGIGEAFLSDGMFLALDGVASLTENLTKLVGKVGVLPIISSGIGAIIAQSKGLKSSLDSLYDNAKAGRAIFEGLGTAIKTSFSSSKIGSGITKEIKNLKGVFVDLGTGLGNSFKLVKSGMGGIVQSAVLAKNGVNGITLAQSGLTLATSGTTLAVSTLKTAFVGLMSTTAGLTLGIGAIAFAIGKIVEKTIKAKQKTKELIETYEENNAKALESYHAMGNNFDDIINQYSKLNSMSKNSMNTEQLEEYNKLTNDIANVLPNAVKYVDANGKAHLKNEEAIKKEVEAIKELSKQESISQTAKYKDGLKEKQKEYKLLTKSLDKYSRTIKKYEEEEKRRESLKNASKKDQYGMAQAYANNPTMPTSLKQYEESLMGLQQVQGAMSMKLSESSIAIAENVKAMMNIDGEMGNVTSTGEGLIDTYAKLNQVSVDKNLTDKEMVEYQEELEKKTQAFANALADSYKSFDDLSEKQRTTARGMMDDILSGFDDDFLKGDNYREKLDGISESIKNIANNSSNFDINAFQKSLEDGGLSAEEAKRATMELGIAMENSSIQSLIASDELAVYNDELSEMTSATWEAIDARNVMLGLSDGESQDISSRLEYLMAMKELNSETWLDNIAVQNELETLTMKTGISKKSIQENTQSIYEAYGTMTSKSAPEIAKLSNMTWEELKEANKEMSDGGITLLQTMLTLFESGAGTIQNSLILALSNGSAEIDKQTESLKKSFKRLAEDPTDTNAEATLFNKISQDLLGLQGQFGVIEDEAGKFKLAMLSGEKSTYLDEINKQLEDLGIQTNYSLNELTGMWEIGFVGADNGLHKIATMNHESELAGIALSVMRDNFNDLINTGSKEDKALWLDSISTQLSTMNDGLTIVKEGTKDAKLELSSGQESPWINELNRQIEFMGGTLKTTKDDAGNLITTVTSSNGNEYVLFTEMQEEAKKANEEIEKTKEKTSELQEKGKEGVEVKVGVVSDVLDKTGQLLYDAETLVENSNINAKVGADTTEFDTANEKITKETETPKKIEISFEVLEQADGTLDTTQARLDTMLQNMRNLEDGVGKVVSLVDVDLLGKNPMVQTLAGAIQEIGNKASESKIAIDELINTITNTKFEVTGEFKINGLDDAKGKIDALATELSNSKSGISTSVAEMQSSLNSLKIGKVNISELGVAKTAIVTATNEIRSILNSYSATVSQSMSVVNESLTFDTSSLTNYSIATTNTISVLIANWSQLGAILPQTILTMSSKMLNTYKKATSEIDSRTIWLQRNMSDRFDDLNRTLTKKMSSISSNMTREFRKGTSELYDIASKIPAQIGKGISDNMSSATNSLQSLADTMVKKFKEALGIHSPSRVFEELGGFVIAGLTNGLSGGNLKTLGKRVFSEFGGEAMSSLDNVKMFLEGGFMPPNFGGEFSMTSAFGKRGSEFHLGDDYGAPMGTPIKAQGSGTVTYSGWMGSYGNMIEVALGNGLSMRYAHNSRNIAQVGDKINAGQIIGLVGSTGNSTGPHVHFEVRKNGQVINPRGWGKFANGGLIESHQFAEIGEEGEEMIIPLVKQRRQRGIDLWLETAKRLGIMDSLAMPFNNGNFYVNGGLGNSGMFRLSEGESGSGGSGEANAGVVKPSMDSVIRAVNPIFSSNASSTKNPLDALYKRDTAQLNIDLTNSYLNKANTQLKTLTENTLAYRNQLQQIQKLNQKLLSQEKSQLSSTQKRQKAIENELKKIKNTSKHTEAQRKKYNELQQEFDNNTKEIWKLEESIASLNNEISNSNVDIYLDFLSEIGNKWDKAISSIEKANSKLQFQIDKLELTNPNDTGGQLKIKYDMLEQQMKLEKTYYNQTVAYQKEYNSASSKYGANSKQALKAKEMLEKAEETYQKEVLNTLKLEKDIKTEREKVATDSISALKTYYKQMETLSKNALAKEKDNLKKAHDEKIKYYDDEISKINEVYDAKIKERDEAKNENEYNEKMQEYNDSRIELMQKISMASKDTSLEGKKKLSELQKELLDLNKEIADAQEARQDELWRKELEKQKEQQIKGANDKKEQENENYEKQLEELEKRENEIMDYYNKITNDETAWKNAVDAWNSGDTSILTELMNDMQGGLSQIMGGDGSGILGGENLSPEDLKELLGDSMLDVSNIWLDIKDQLEELNSINKNLNDLNAKSQKGSNTSGTVITDGKGKAPTTSQSNTSPNLSVPTPPKPKPSAGNNNKVKANHTIVNGDTLWDLAKKYYGNFYDWKKIQKANGNVNPYRLQIGKKLIIPFESGGYTGDWFGNEGRVAMLHKKELVLNKNQTKDIFDTVSIIDRAKDKFDVVMNRIKTMPNGGGAGNTMSFGDVNLTFEKFRGTQSDSERVAKDFLDKVNKRK